MKQQIRRRLSGEAAIGAYSSVTLILSYPVMVVAGLWPNPWLFVIAAAVGYLSEAVTNRYATYLGNALSQVHIGVALRATVRELALLVLLARAGGMSDAEFTLFAAAVFSLHAIRAAQSSLAVYVRRRRRLPVVTRGIDLSELRIPNAPHPLLVQRYLRTMVNLDLLPVAGGAAWVISGAHWPATAGAAAAVALGVAAVVVTLPHALRARALADGKRVIAVVNEQIRRHRPQVALYFSGSLDSVYQINMWLSTLDRLDRPALIILRERGMVPLLARTSSPVVCVPATIDLPLLDLSSIQLTLYPANAGKNLHMLRTPGITSVFINHGDSDKAASFNPYAKVYDQVWVAGPAGRDRYLRAQVGVHDDKIVEVGRPQLAPIHTDRPTPDPMLTVLYAPTWEGWTGDPFHTSVALMGPAIVAALLDHLPHVRVLYKPHPLTGKDDIRVRRAHEKIVALIRRANHSRENSGEWADPAAEAAATQAARRLEALTRQLAVLDDPGGARDAGAVARARTALRVVTGSKPDEAQLSRDGVRVDPAVESAWHTTFDSWHENFWASEGWWRHRIITGQNPHLYQCFNRCDLLITDVSSVVPDFISSGKPYVVTNPGNADPDEFCELNPTAGAAYLLGGDCAELADVLAEVEKEGADRLAGRRRELKTYLLGSDEPAGPAAGPAGGANNGGGANRNAKDADAKGRDASRDAASRDAASRFVAAVDALSPYEGR